MVLVYPVFFLAAFIAGLDRDGWKALCVLVLFAFGLLSIILPSTGEWLDTRLLKREHDAKGSPQSVKEPTWYSRFHDRASRLIKPILRYFLLSKVMRLDALTADFKKDGRSLSHSFKAWGRLSAALGLAGLSAAKIYFPGF